jgi:hypothetical protein
MSTDPVNDPDPAGDEAFPNIEPFDPDVPEPEDHDESVTDADQPEPEQMGELDALLDH